MVLFIYLLFGHFFCPKVKSSIQVMYLPKVILFRLGLSRGRLFHRLPCLVLYQICLEVRNFGLFYKAGKHQKRKCTCTGSLGKWVSKFVFYPVLTSFTQCMEFARLVEEVKSTKWSIPLDLLLQKCFNKLQYETLAGTYNNKYNQSFTVYFSGVVVHCSCQNDVVLQ